MSKKNDNKKDKKKPKLTHTYSNSSVVPQSTPSTVRGPNIGTLPSSYTFPLEQILSFAPEALLFTNLLEFEKRLDSAITKRLVDNQETKNRSQIKQTRILRMSIYNTFSNQSAFYHLDNKSLVGVQEKPSWTLRIEGKLLDDNINNSTTIYKGGYTQQVGNNSINSNTSGGQKKRKFSSFFKKVFIQIGHRDSCEWDKSQSLLETDGFEVKRNGHQEVEIKILMYLDNSPQKYKVMGNLAVLLNIHTDTKTKIISALWNYIKINKLLDLETKKINCDEALKNIFGLDVLQFNQIPQLLREYLGAPDPLEFNYSLKLTGDSRDHEQAFNIQVEVDEISGINQNMITRNVIQNLDEEINQNILKINHHKRKREFMSKLADNPLQFLQDQTQSLVKDYQVMKSNSSSGFEEDRHASFYYQPLMDDVVSKYLSKQSIPPPSPINYQPSTPQSPE